MGDTQNVTHDITMIMINAGMIDCASMFSTDIPKCVSSKNVLFRGREREREKERERERA